MRIASVPSLSGAHLREGVLAAPLRAGNEAQHFLGGGEVAETPRELGQGLDETLRFDIRYLRHLETDGERGIKANMARVEECSLGTWPIKLAYNS